MLTTPKSRAKLFLASSLRDGLEDNDFRQVKTLLTSKEADPNVLISNLGVSPFHLVVGIESEEFATKVSKLFLRHAGDPNVRSADGTTPVHVAAAWGRVGILELLLANGGDPLILDDEGRSPFHYAFEGGFSEAIAVLGKYCGSSQDEETYEPKYKLTLDKILVNRGNVVAEYLPSENSYLESTKTISCLASEPTNSLEAEKLVNQSENVTLRRYQKKSAKTSAASDAVEKNNLVRRIIEDLSTGPESSIISGSEIDGKMLRKPIKQFLVGENEITAIMTGQGIDSSMILGKSPNCRIPKTLKNLPRGEIDGAKRGIKSKIERPIFPGSSTDENLGICREPKESQFDQLYSKSPKSLKNSKKIVDSPKSRNNKIPGIKARSDFLKKFDDLIGSFGDQDFGLQDEKSRPEFLGNSLLEQEVGKIPTGSDSETVEKLENETKDLDSSEKEEKYETGSERDRATESPGSSNPLSICRSLKFDDEEDSKILLEIDQLSIDRCPTPPASISLIEENPDDFHSDYSSGDHSSIVEFCEAYACPTLPLYSDDTFLSLEEEYTYEDQEEGIAFVQRHLRVIPAGVHKDMNRAMEELSWIDRLENLSIVSSDATISTIIPDGWCQDAATLRDRLRQLGDEPGPITKTTQKVYLKRLWKLEKIRGKSREPIAGKSPKTKRQMNAESVQKTQIPEHLRVIDIPSRCDFYRALEEKAFQEYVKPTNLTRKFRGGISKTSFCYLLLDPRITEDLPRRGLEIPERWNQFLEAIFYVGKGKAARPAAHLYDAYKAWSSRRASGGQIGKKIQRILDIWQSDRGVVCLHVFHHTMDEEACSREAAMIEALGTDRLTNCVSGTFYGYSSTMCREEKRSLGKFLLYKSMEILMHEGERQLFPRNVLM